MGARQRVAPYFVQGRLMARYDAIVLSGGGPMAACFLGCVRYLEQVGLLSGATTLVGTSAGAIVALFCAVGMTADEMEAWVRRHRDSGELTALDLKEENPFELAERLGLDDGARVIGCVRQALTGRGLPADPTFRDLAKAVGRNLVICASNLDAGVPEYFGVDTTPDVPVLLALRMSMGIPLLYTPVRHRGCAYVDGALFDNCPVRGAGPNARQVLALDALVAPPHPAPRGGADSEAARGDEKEREREVQDEEDLLSYVGRLLQAAFANANRLAAAADDPARVHRVSIPPPRPTLSMWNQFSVTEMRFRMDDALLEELVCAGYDALQAALQDRPGLLADSLLDA